MRWYCSFLKIVRWTRVQIVASAKKMKPKFGLRAMPAGLCKSIRNFSDICHSHVTDFFNGSNCSWGRNAQATRLHHRPVASVTPWLPVITTECKKTQALAASVPWCYLEVTCGILTCQLYRSGTNTLRAVWAVVSPSLYDILLHVCLLYVFLLNSLLLFTRIEVAKSLCGIHLWPVFGQTKQEETLNLKQLFPEQP